MKKAVWLKKWWPFEKNLPVLKTRSLCGQRHNRVIRESDYTLTKNDRLAPLAHCHPPLRPRVDRSHPCPEGLGGQRDALQELDVGDLYLLRRRVWLRVLGVGRARPSWLLSFLKVKSKECLYNLNDSY